MPNFHQKALQLCDFPRSGIFKLQPSEQLQLNRSASWEVAVEEMWQEVLMPMGFKLEASDGSSAMGIMGVMSQTMRVLEGTKILL